ncbi:uncharacterized protein LAESUDRAFT_748613 [Laetiporus sulphureus 93-53]|uniref:Uncharacterized protein n=1 Tax=Laetiporus sulphureus 93-53 TaxID=1314785 RepID=A0A165FI26_9APHY|nr:uncharacterized protein LAESUDRAFT_748613 [Laetiporus sulphureus 93-53]KZT09003.1 hypothetical protein LAESUDRAFT_748613 [Laetiporus sulphureus 93-53]
MAALLTIHYSPLGCLIFHSAGASVQEPLPPVSHAHFPRLPCQTSTSSSKSQRQIFLALHGPRQDNPKSAHGSFLSKFSKTYVNSFETAYALLKTRSNKYAYKPRRRMAELFDCLSSIHGPRASLCEYSEAVQTRPFGHIVKRDDDDELSPAKQLCSLLQTSLVNVTASRIACLFWMPGIKMLRLAEQWHERFYTIADMTADSARAETFARVHATVIGVFPGSEQRVDMSTILQVKNATVLLILHAPMKYKL